MAMTRLPIVAVNGQIYKGWQTLQLRLSLNSVARTFSMGASSHDFNTLRGFKFKMNDAVEIGVDTQRILNGCVSRISPSHEKDSFTIAISGASNTGRLAKDSAEFEGGSFVNLKAHIIAGQLAAAFGVPFLCDFDSGEPLQRFTLDTGESYWSAIQRLAAMRSFLVYDDGDGNLIAARTGTSRCTDELIDGRNCISTGAEFSSEERYRDYICYAQRPGYDNDGLPQIVGNFGTAQDPSMPFGRLAIYADEAASAEDCIQRAQWECNYRAAGGTSINVTAPSWYQSDDVLWQPNMIVHFASEWLDVDADLLISEVTLSAPGDRAELTLIPPEAAMTEPLEDEADPLAETPKVKNKKTATKNRTVIGPWKELA